MKKKSIAAFLAASMVFGLTACGSATPSASDVTSNRKPASADEQEEEVAEELELPDTLTGETEAEESEEAAEETTTSAKGVVFGSKEASGYTDFEYLMEAIIATSETKSGDKVSYSVYIPDDDYSSVSGAIARSSRMGVTFEIDINPYLQYEAEDYTVVENLEEYVTSMMEYASDSYYGISVGEVQELADGSAICEVSYMDYDSYDDVYYPYFEQYNLKEMEDGIYALTVVEIDADETTGKTADLISEIESFYQVDINWDESFADTKRAEFENSDEFNPDAFNLGFMSFELPEGWAKDEEESSYDEYVFAPDGNYALADVAITVTNDWTSEDIVSALLSDEEYTKTYFESYFEGMMDDITVEDMGETFMGRTAKITIEASTDDGSGILTYYMGQVDSEAYVIYVYSWEGASTEEVVNTIFETGVVK
ncbi:MAG: hypothetical protein IJO97_02655 [Lachnospiraceae bacterium]|nr:hypothetical protein [Lachnospiraceae bacterium]